MPVTFFGTYELAWLPASSVKGFKEGLASRAHLNNRKAVAAFRKGLSEVLDYFKVGAWCTWQQWSSPLELTFCQAALCMRNAVMGQSHRRAVSRSMGVPRQAEPLVLGPQRPVSW